MPRPPKWNRHEWWLLATPLLVPLLLFVARQLQSVQLPSLPAPTPLPTKKMVMPTPVIVPTAMPEPSPIPCSTLPPSATIKLDGLKTWSYGSANGHALVLEFSPRGHWMAGTLTEKTLGLWDVKTGKLQKQFTLTEELYLTPMAFSPDESKLVVAGSRSNQYWVFDLKAQNFSPRIMAARPGDLFTQVEFSPDGQLFATARHPDDVDVVSLASGRLLYHLDWTQQGQGLIDENTITPAPCATFSNDGLLLATGGRDSMVTLWNAKTGALIKVLGNHAGAAWKVKFSPDGKWLVSGGEDGAKVWNVKTRTLRRSFGDACFDLDFSPDNRHIIMGHSGGLQLWDALAGLPVHALNDSGLCGNTDLKFAPDGKSVLFSGSYRLPARWDIRPFLKTKR